MSPIESSIRDLELICRVVRPFPSPLEPGAISNANRSTVALPSSFFEAAGNPCTPIVQQLLEFTSADIELKHLVWCVYAAHYKTVSKEKVLAFLKALDDYKTCNSAALQALREDVNEGSFESLNKLPFPPVCRDKAPSEACLALALYHFYKARLLWALCLLGDQDGSIELAAYFHVYEFLVHTRTALTAAQEFTHVATQRCENLRIGFSPLLYLAGRCCPTPTWLRWIIEELKTVGEEGLFLNDPFAATLEILLFLEEHAKQSLNLSPSEERFVTPRSRTIAIFIPDIDGQSFEAYFARPQDSQIIDENETFLVSRVAHWSNLTKGLRPLIQDYEIFQQPFTKEWLLEQHIVQKWVEWNCDTGFNLNQVIQDHIKGNRLLLEIEAR